MHSFRIISISDDEISIDLDGQTGIIPVDGVDPTDQDQAVEKYIEAIVAETPVSPTMVRQAVEAHLGTGS